MEGTRRSVVATLGTPEPAGCSGEGDRLVDVESLTGGERADRLTGDGGANRLAGGRGADSLVGGPGNDHLEGGPGNDVLRGDDGADVLMPTGIVAGLRYPSRGHSTRLLCGAGPDTVSLVRADDRVADDCERLLLQDSSDRFDLLLPQPALTAPIARLREYHCAHRICRIEMTVRAGDRLLGRRRLRVRRPLAHGVALRLSPAGRRILRRAGRLRATIRFTHDERSDAWSAVLRAPPDLGPAGA